jgi:hypothetical protein
VKLCYYKGAHPNFGDELSFYLMPKVFPNLFDDDPTEMFLGIGSIIYNDYPVANRKIVFGSGYGGYTPAPKLDSNWRVYCVRGPLTARALELPPDTVAADSAILINRFRAPRKHTGTRISFMPHWLSAGAGRWQKACADCGFNFIDPRLPVERVLDEIESSSVLLAEAMHGAIVADALRVPWVPLQPIDALNRGKWFDWASALNLSLPINSLFPSSLPEMKVILLQRSSFKKLRQHARDIYDPAKEVQKKVSILNSALTYLATKRLWQLARTEPLLSSEKSLSDALDKLETHAESIKKDHHLI